MALPPENGNGPGTNQCQHRCRDAPPSRGGCRARGSSTSGNARSAGSKDPEREHRRSRASRAYRRLARRGSPTLGRMHSSICRSCVALVPHLASRVCKRPVPKAKVAGAFWVSARLRVEIAYRGMTSGRRCGAGGEPAARTAPPAASIARSMGRRLPRPHCLQRSKKTGLRYPRCCASCEVCQKAHWL